MLQWFKSRGNGSRGQRRTFRPALENLEERAVPAGLPNATGHTQIVIPHAQVSTVFYGDAWNNANDPYAAEMQAERKDLTEYFTDLLKSPYMAGLGEYTGHGYSLDSTYQILRANGQGYLAVENPIGTGAFVGTETVGGALSTKTPVSGQVIANMLASEMQSKHLPGPDDNHLYFVFLPPNIKLDGGNGSNADAYHSSFSMPGLSHPVYFAAMSHPIGNDGWRPNNMTNFQTLSTICSHELVEAATDPTGQSWYADKFPSAFHGGEIGDLADGGLTGLGGLPQFKNYSQFATVDGFFVQQYWSNKFQTGIAPGGVQVNITGSGNLVNLPTGLPNVSFAEFDLQTQGYLSPMSVPVHFGAQSGTTVPVTWGSTAGPYAKLTLNGYRIDLTIYNQAGYQLFWGSLAPPNGDWHNHLELQGTVAFGSQPAFGPQVHFYSVPNGGYVVSYNGATVKGAAPVRATSLHLDQPLWYQARLLVGAFLSQMMGARPGLQAMFVGLMGDARGRQQAGIISQLWDARSLKVRSVMLPGGTPQKSGFFEPNLFDAFHVTITPMTR
jgi:hypothetical protein